MLSKGGAHHQNLPFMKHLQLFQMMISPTNLDSFSQENNLCCTSSSTLSVDTNVVS